MGQLWRRIGIGLALAVVGLVVLGAATAVAAEGADPAAIAAEEPVPVGAVAEPPTPTEVAAAIPTPSCAEGPQRDGEVIVGTDCADHIVVPPAVSYVDGGPGDDTIVGSLTTAASCEAGCHLGVGSQTIDGGEGNDIIYGDRGNDILRGNGGNDRLYGGIGDDRIEGGTGDDWMSGGFGADTIDGGEGSDYVRGDGTVDHLFDTGTVGTDTLSFATGVTPGFTAAANPTGAANFPGPEGERGIYLEIGEPGPGPTGFHAVDGEPSDGGGNDEVQRGAFERIIGTPFSDYIVGTAAGEEIIGGGGADVIKGGGGKDFLRGGADGDFLEVGSGTESTTDGEAGVDGCVGETVEVECEGTAKEVHPRVTSTVSVGETAAGSGSVDVYLVGSAGNDSVIATYAPGAVSFELKSGSFDSEPVDAGGCALGSQSPPTTATCLLGAPASPVPALDAIVLAGMDGADTITANGFPDGSSVIELGGEDGDTLTGGPSEDVLVDGDGPGADTLSAGAGDDALLHNGGADTLDGGEGSDLFLSVAICDGEKIDGGPSVGSDRDNASWARLGGGGGVDARLDLGEVGEVGEVGANEMPTCAPGGTLDRLEGIEDLEGSEGNDVLYGNAETNQLLGHKGEDIYRALGGNDTIFANSGSPDKVIDCGEGTEDSAVIDLAAVGDPPPIGCERVREGAANEFQEEIELPLPAPVTVAPPSPTPAPTAPAPKPKLDRTPPRTKLLRRPGALLRVAPRHRAAVTFRFAASERSRFECKLDSRPYRRCRSPLHARLAPGRHTFRVFAIDAAGNRDRTPALLHLRVVPRRPRRPA
jgi:Ca2+-binding RTX toxin-like protein